VKIVNYNHILPTRFQVTGEFAQGSSELRQVVTEDKLANKDTRKKLKNEVKAIFTERYVSKAVVYRFIDTYLIDLI
jgi:hypothetical protein